MYKIVFNSIFRQSIKNTLKCLFAALILIIRHWTHNTLKCFTKCPRDVILIIIQTSTTKFKSCFQRRVAATCVRAPSSVPTVYRKMHCMEFTAILGTK